MEEQISTKKLSDEFVEFRNETRTHFDEVDKRFEQVDKRFEGIDNRLDKHEELLHRLVQYSMKNEERISRIEETFATKEDIRGIHIKLDEILGYVKK